MVIRPLPSPLQVAIFVLGCPEQGKWIGGWLGDFSLNFLVFYCANRTLLCYSWLLPHEEPEVYMQIQEPVVFILEFINPPEDKSKIAWIHAVFLLGEG